ncbi:MAG TPA: M20/M25/M40 family metallo-hydrolase [Solirubrobacteraceae bacterium]|jgi:glutamate carboxypeptidase|nr:M20/M25/M40 family metallo-hydrolase [Solirubrobacteraceae bacterium]
MSTVIDPVIAAEAAEIRARAWAELAELVDISSPSGDVDGAERALELCAHLLPHGATVERPACSTPGSAPDLIGTVTGTGTGRVLLLGHVDTVIGHDAHQPLRREGDRLYGTGTVDMKGGDILALGVARALATRPEDFAELAVLMVTDEEWRTQPFAHAARFAGYDACLCFEGGQLGPEREEGVVVRRKAAGTLKVLGTGRASHSGSAPDQGRNALLALARTADALAGRHDPHGPEQLSVVPTVMRSGDAFNIVPAAGELVFDLRARRLQAFEPVLEAVAPELDGVALEARMERKWPGMDSTAVTEPLIAGASLRLGRAIVGVPRGGASDASHFAETIALTVDGLGPRGGGAHTPEEFVLEAAMGSRAEVALALAHEVLNKN